MQRSLRSGQSGTFDYVVAEALDRVSRGQEDRSADLLRGSGAFRRPPSHSCRGRDQRTACRTQGHHECAVLEGRLLHRDIVAVSGTGFRSGRESAGGNSYKVLGRLAVYSRRWIGFDRPKQRMETAFTSGHHPARLPASTLMEWRLGRSPRVWIAEQYRNRAEFKWNTCPR